MHKDQIVETESLRKQRQNVRLTWYGTNTKYMYAYT